MSSILYKRYLLGLLAAILLFNFVDRLALGIVLQEIKVELHLNDTQLGLLTGIAFTLFYATMGIPIARWADRGNRVTIISLTTLLWTVAVALCGVAGSFIQLMAVRVAVAVGESGCVPPAISLLASYFTRTERPRATAIYNMGGPMSYVIGYFLAGWLNELYGWRKTFLFLASPGLILTALAWFTLREPRKTGAVVAQASLDDSSTGSLASRQPTLKEVCATLWSCATFRHMLLCWMVFYFCSGITVWMPAFFGRTYGLTTGEIGSWLTFSNGIGGVLGAYFGGAWASRYAADNERLQLKAMTAAFVTGGALSIGAFLVSNPYPSFWLIGLAGAAFYTTVGPMSAMLQSLVPERMRAVSFALIALAGNLIGMGLGPLAAGVLSDAYFHWAHENSLRYALLTGMPGYFLAAWYAWRASKTVMRDLRVAAAS